MRPARVCAGSRARRRIPVSRNAPSRNRCKAGRVPTTCLIVDDNKWFLSAARVLLEQEGLNVIAVASTGSEAREQALALRPDIALVDIWLGEESGIDLARSLVDDDRCDRMAVVLISTRAEDDVADLLAGSPAIGFLSKSDLSASAIHQIVDGRER
jgi:DNA-binding NarL/FixJ family response regulator